MRHRPLHIRWTRLAALMLCLMAAGLCSAWAHGAAADGQDAGEGDNAEAAAKEPPRELASRFRSNAWRLTHKAGRGKTDLFYVVEKMVRPTGDLADSIKKIEEECRSAKNEKQQKECHQRLRQALGKDQRAVVDEAMAALEKLQDEQQEAARKFLQAADPGARKKTDVSEGRINTSDLTQYLDLPGPPRKEVDRLIKEMYARVDKRMAGQEPPENLAPKEARRWKSQKHREARQEARQWYEGQRENVLNEKQLARLAELEKAAQQYRERLRDAHRTCADTLQNIMLAAAGYPVDQSDDK
jgi:hypothetical protein